MILLDILAISAIQDFISRVSPRYSNRFDRLTAMSGMKSGSDNVSSKSNERRSNMFRLKKRGISRIRDRHSRFEADETQRRPIRIALLSREKDARATNLYKNSRKRNQIPLWGSVYMQVIAGQRFRFINASKNAILQPASGTAGAFDLIESRALIDLASEQDPGFLDKILHAENAQISLWLDIGRS